MVMTLTRKLVPSLPSRAWIILGGDALSALGSGLTLPFFFVYLHNVRGIAHGTAGLILATVALIGFAGNPLGGTLTDRIGARWALVTGLSTAAAGTVSIAAVNRPWQGFAAAAVYGLGMSVVVPSQDALMAAAVPAERRSSVFAVGHATLNVGLGVGALLAALTVGSASPSNFVRVYLLDATSFLVFAVVVARLRVGATASATAAADDGARHGGAGYRAILRDPLFVRLWLLVAILVASGYAQFHAAFPAYATERGGLAARTLGLVFAANTCVVVLAQLPILKLVSGRRRTRALMLSTGFVALSWLVTLAGGQVWAARGAVALFVTAMVLLAIGETLFSPTAPAIVNDLATDEVRGRYNGAYALAWTTGFATGPALAGLAFATGHGDGLFVGLLAALAWVAYGAWRLEGRLPIAANLVTADGGA
jgi:MFS family permease